MKKLVSLLGWWLSAASWGGGDASAKGLDMESLRPWPVQAGGRIKPLDTYARETVRWMTGQEEFQGWDPLQLFCAWSLDGDAWKAKPVIEIRHLAFKRRIGIPEQERWISMNDLAPKIEGLPWIADAAERLRRDQKLNAEEQEGVNALQKLMVMAHLVRGGGWPIVPHPRDPQSPWVSVAEAGQAFEGEYPPAALELVKQRWRTWVDAYRVKEAQSWRAAGPALREAIAALPVDGGDPGRSFRLPFEVQFNKIRPFRLAWMAYGLALLVLVFTAAGVLPAMGWAGYGFWVIGLGLHAYGITARSVIAGHPPVTNMYESVVWVTFGASFFGALFEWWAKRARYFAYGALTAGVLGLVLADNLPNVLNPNLDPLVPVLRNNFWLTVHVLTITLSYAAFTLGLFVGHLNVWGAVFHPSDRDRLTQWSDFLYRVLQVGVLLLASGTILGGVWAAESWGRFWGWDPKETMALVALLGYVALLHSRRAGWVKVFGLAAGSIVAYQGILVAWYGVNFVLGQGLHSYGFGTGGVSYVAGYVALEAAFLGWMAMKRSIAPEGGLRGEA